MPPGDSGHRRWGPGRDAAGGQGGGSAGVGPPPHRPGLAGYREVPGRGGGPGFFNTFSVVGQGTCCKTCLSEEECAVSVSITPRVKQ